MMRDLWKSKKFITVLSLFLFCMFGAIFGAITEEIWADKQFLPFDLTTNHWMAINQEPHDRRFFLAINYLSEFRVFAALTLVITACLWFCRRRMESALFISGLGAIGVSVFILKSLTVRIRPSGAAALHEVSGSFPSSHAALSVFFFGFLAYLLARRSKKKLYGLLMFSIGLSIAGLIGASRIYLDIHWVSDVLGGFAMGAAFLSLCIGFLEVKNKPVH